MDDSGIQIIKHLDCSQHDLVYPIAFLGCPGIADVGKFAIDSLIGQLEAKNYIDIIFDEYPAGAIVDDSILSAPKAEILLWKDNEKKRDLILITSDAQSLTPKGIYKISNFLAKCLHQFGVKLVVALGAYPVNKQALNTRLPKIYITSTSKELLESYLKKNKFEKLQKGVIIGANGLIPTLAKARFNIDGLVLLAETDNIAMINEDITDLKASMALLEILQQSFNLPIKHYSIENIDEMSKNLESKKNKLEKDLESFQFIDTAEEKRKSLYI